MADNKPEEKKESKQEAKAAEPKKEKREDAKPQEQKKGAPGRKAEEKRLTSVVRLAGKDVNGSLPLERAVDQIKGIGSSMSHSLVYAIETKLNMPKSTTLSSLSEEQVERLEEFIKAPSQHGVPQFMLNHQKDMETGKNLHLLSNDLLFATRQDVARDVNERTWRGHRHQYGQKVRGQHTRSTGRTGATVGVVKKAEAAKLAPAKAGEAKEEKGEKKEKPAAVAAAPSPAAAEKK